MAAEQIATIISAGLLFLVGFRLGEERGKGEQNGEPTEI